MKHTVLFALLALFLVACQGQMTDQELFNKVKSGTVLVYNKYYYELSTPQGSKLYFNGIDAQGDLENTTFDQVEAKQKANVLNGTAFFVDKEGSLLTNRHVAQPSLTNAEVKRAYTKLVHGIAAVYAYAKQQLSEQYNTLENEKASCYTYDYYGNTVYDEAKITEINSQQEELKNKFQTITSNEEELTQISDVSDLQMRVVSEIGIAYDNTYVTSESDFLTKNPAVVVRVSDKPDVDLALLQLKDKRTPANRYVYTIEERADKPFYASWFEKKHAQLEVGDVLHMVGYNAGLALGNTQTGIKAQMTSGKVTQPSDGRKILYDLSSLSGSSGSPIVDANGYLVAVNFAKIKDTDTFNFGIPKARVRDFMEWR